MSYNPVGEAPLKRFEARGAGGRLVLFGGRNFRVERHFSALNFWAIYKFIPAGLMMSSRSILGVNMLKIADHQPMIMHEAI